MTGGGGMENVRLDSTLAAAEDVFTREPVKENGALDMAADWPVPN